MLETSPEDEVPPSGTPCIVCRALGHWCAAYRYVGKTDEGICRPCLEFKNCPLNQRGSEENDLVDFRAVKKEILDAPQTELDASVAVRVGCTPHYVRSVRKQAGVPLIMDKCSVEECPNNARGGYSFCDTKHRNKLEEQIYERLVASRKANKSKYHKKDKPKPVKELIAHIKYEDSPASTTTIGQVEWPVPELTQEIIIEMEKQVELEVQKEIETVMPAIRASEEMYSAVIRDVEAKILQWQSLLGMLKLLRGA